MKNETFIKGEELKLAGIKLEDIAQTMFIYVIATIFFTLVTYFEKTNPIYFAAAQLILSIFLTLRVYQLLREAGNNIIKSVSYNGSYETFYTNGQTKEKGYYENGNRQGIWESFFENGKLLSRGTFVNDLKNGLWETFYDNGQIKMKQNFKEGKLHGLSQYYDNRGNKTLERNH